MLLAEYLNAKPDRAWTLAAQLGVQHAVVRMPENENGIPVDFSFKTLKKTQQALREAHFSMDVLEPAPANQLIKAGLPGRDKEIESFITLLRDMGKLGIRQICPNFMYQIGWYRSTQNIVTRGGALVTGYSPEKAFQDMRSAELTHEKMFENLFYFLDAVVPEAEKAGVQIALHPDDPPVPYLHGIPRILTSPENFDRILDRYPSEALGLTFCQGCFAEMGVNIPEQIEHFARRKKLFAAHFRDVEGDAENGFEERFHDNGKTDMFAAVQAYQKADPNAFLRVDHVPTMDGESNDKPGYAVMGRLFAIGYWKGLMEAAEKTEKFSKE